MASRPTMRRKVAKAIAANSLSMSGQVRRCYVCGAIRLYHQMVMRTRGLWSCGDGNHKEATGG